MSAAGGEAEGIGAKADNNPDAVAAIIEQQMTPRSSIDLKKFKAFWMATLHQPALVKRCRRCGIRLRATGNGRTGWPKPKMTKTAHGYTTTYI